MSSWERLQQTPPNPELRRKQVLKTDGWMTAFVPSTQFSLCDARAAKLPAATSDPRSGAMDDPMVNTAEGKLLMHPLVGLNESRIIPVAGA